MWGFVIWFRVVGRGNHKWFLIGRCWGWVVHRCRWAVGGSDKWDFIGWSRCWYRCYISSIMKAKNVLKSSTSMFGWRITFEGCMVCHRFVYHRCRMVYHRCSMVDNRCNMVSHRCFDNSMADRLDRLYMVSAVFVDKVV